MPALWTQPPSEIAVFTSSGCDISGPSMNENHQHNFRTLRTEHSRILSMSCERTRWEGCAEIRRRRLARKEEDDVPSRSKEDCRGAARQLWAKIRAKRGKSKAVA
jgi:hypothetical protein